MDILQIFQQYNLNLIKPEIFGKKHIFLAADPSGRRMIVKADRVNPAEAKLLKIAKKIEPELCFKTPEVVIQGGDFVALEEIAGKHLNKFFSGNTDGYMKISKNIADDYQKIVFEYLQKNNPGNLLEDGRKWLFDSFSAWHKPIVENGLIEQEWFDRLEKMLKNSVEEKGEKFFGWCHKNIIGDHILVLNGNYYLLDLNIASRPGKGYYDFLRAVDWIFLKSDKLSFDGAADYIKRHLSEFDRKEVELVFAFRCVGILGCDILKNGDNGTGDFEQKKRDLVRFIRIEY